jgi:hypothetical protein
MLSTAPQHRYPPNAMFSSFVTFTTPIAPAPKTPEEIPSDYESGGAKGGVCVVAARPAAATDDLPSDWESGGAKGGVCVVA